MTIVPRSRPDAIDWLGAHLPVWTADPTSIGLTIDLVADLATKHSEALAAETDADEANNAKLAASASFRSKADTMRESAVAAVQAIKAFAQTSGDPSVYQAAQIPEPASPSPAEPPEAPSELTATFINGGRLDLAWKGKGPQGTFYNVLRRLDEADSYASIGTTTSKSFLDETLPGGTSRVEYQVVAQQTSNKVYGPEFIVRLGSGNGAQDVQVAA